MPASPISRVVLNGFKSIKNCDIELTNLNVLIGANGAGKSNFISFFRMIKNILDKNLQLYISKQGGPDAILHFGRKVTENISAEIYFGNNGYNFALEPTQDNKMVFTHENFWWNLKGDWKINSGHFESEAETQKNKTQIYKYTVPAMKSWRIYHFHDTGENAPVKQMHNISDNEYIKTDGGNLAAFLHLIKEKHPTEYNRIVKTIKLAAPFFEDFVLRPNPFNNEKIELEWKEKESSVPFKAHYLSDGTLRFICIVTVLMQPEEFMPETIIIDEPELGLHPYAINLLASIIRSVSSERQIIISTQSTDLLNGFEPEDILVTDFSNGETNLRRLDGESLKNWLEDYTLGELWHKNLLGGRP